MFGKLLVIFITVPLLEVLILIKMGEVFGFWPTVMLVVVTGFLGALLARIEGFRTWLNIQQELREGQLPAEKMIDALLLFAAGLFLITPGVLTDILGFLLLIPATRHYFKQWLRNKFDDLLRSSQNGGSAGIRFFIR
ncbi:MAG: FxsA family protein [Candidatus Omnitrophota bacterium]